MSVNKTKVIEALHHLDGIGLDEELAESQAIFEKMYKSKGHVRYTRGETYAGPRRAAIKLPVQKMETMKESLQHILNMVNEQIDSGGKNSLSGKSVILICQEALNSGIGSEREKLLLTKIEFIASHSFLSHGSFGEEEILCLSKESLTWAM